MSLPTAVDFAQFRLAAGAWTLLLPAVLGGIAFWLYRRQLRDVSGFRRTLLPLLRAVAVAAIALMIAQPSVHRSRTFEQPGQVIVIRDDSRSMAVPDPQTTTGRKLLISRALELSDTGSIDWTLHDLSLRAAALEGAIVSALARTDNADAEYSPREWSDEAGAIAETLAELDPELLQGADVRGSAAIEFWAEVPGRRIADLEREDIFDRPPDRRETIGSLRLPTNVGDNFARRIRGRLHPPETSTYTFHLAADTGAVLLLSPGEDAAGAQEILRVTRQTAPDDISHASRPVRLESGRSYAFELQHKEGEHDDHLTLFWSRSGRRPEVIAGDDLSLPARLVDPATRREELAETFRSEVASPAATVPELPSDQQEEAARQVAGALGQWREAFAELFDAHAQAQLERGAPEAVAAVAAFDAMSRSQRIDRLMEDTGSGSLASALASSGDVEVVRTNARSEQGSDEPSGADSNEAATDLAAALERVKPAEDRPQAIVLLSDGRHNSGESPVDIAASLGRRGAAVYPVLIGSALPPPDLAVLEVVGPTAVHKDDQVTGRIVLVDAMPPGRPFTLRITEGETTLWEEDLETTGRGRREVEFALEVDDITESRLPPQERGARFNELLLPLQVEATAVEGEMQSDNNLRDLPVRVTLGTGRLLVVDGRPRWDSRFIASLLGRDRRWQVREVIGPDLSGRRLRRGDEGFPASREALFEYDVVVLGEVPVEWWDPQELEWIAAFVDERGGGLILVDGMRGAFHDYAGTPLERIMPVMREAGPPVRVQQLRLTSAGEQRDALRLEPDSQRNAALWASLAPPRWVIPASLLPGGEVLVEAVTEEGLALPAVVTSRVGRGRVWYQSFDETWRWRKDAESRWQSRYWSGVANRIMEPPFASEDRFVSLGVEEAAVEPGAKVGVRARLRDESGSALAGTAAAEVRASAVLLRDGRPVADARLTPDASGGGLFRAEVQAPLEAGVYEVAVTADRYSDADLTARASLLVRHASSSGELARLDADEALMRQLADASGGRFLLEHEAQQLPELLQGLSRSRTVVSEYDIWTSWPLFGTAIGLLGIEWLIRRRTGML